MLNLENLAEKNLEKICRRPFLRFVSRTDRALRNFFIFLIRIYQGIGSPHMGGACRFYPTCSHYGIEAFRKFHFKRALMLTTKRILRCRPLGAFGLDPLPEKHHD